MATAVDLVMVAITDSATITDLEDTEDLEVTTVDIMVDIMVATTDTTIIGETAIGVVHRAIQAEIQITAKATDAV